MSEAKWLDRTKAFDLLRMLTAKARRKRADPRLLRPCACDCARQPEPLLRSEDAVCRTAVAEALADGAGAS